MMVTRRSQIPGARFNPTDPELIDHYLRRRNERGKSSSFIYEMDMYEKEPWLLQHVRHFRSIKNVWYYFVTRKKRGETKKSDSEQTSRTAGAGTWKTTGCLSQIYKDGVKVGTMQLISFKINNERTGWVMHEYILHQLKQGYQKDVLCRIKFEPGKDNSLYMYAPRLEPILIGQPQPHPQIQPPLGEEEKQNSNDVHVAAAQDIQYLDAPFETQQGIEQHQDVGSYGQLFGALRQSNILGLVEEHDHNYGFGNMAEYHNQFRRQATDASHSAHAIREQQWIEYPGPYSAQPYDPSQLPMELQKQYILATQHQRQIIGQATHLSSQLPVMMNQATEKQHYSQPYHQNNDLSVVPMETQQQHGFPLMTTNQTTEPPHLTQEQQQPCAQATTHNLMHQHYGYGNMAAYPNQFWRQETDPSLWAQAMGKNQLTGYSGPYLAQPSDQNHYNVESFEENVYDYNQLVSLIDFQGLAEDTDPSQLPMELQEHYILGDQHQLFSVEQQQNQIIGQATNLSSQLPVMINQAIEEQHYSQPYNQSFGQNNDLSVVPMETQQQNDDPLMPMNQTTEPPHLTQEQQQPCAQATTHNLVHQHYGYGNMADYLNQFCREETNPPLSAQAMGEHQRIGNSGPYLAQPYDQNHHNVESFEENECDYNQLISLIDFEGLAEDTDPSQLPMELQEQYILGDQHQHFSMEQQKHHIIGQTTHLSSQLPVKMNLAIDEPHYCQPYHQNSYLSVVPMETQQQDNVVGNLASQLQLEEQNNVPLMTMIQTTEPPELTQEQQQPCEQATTHNELIQEMDPAISSLLFGQNTTEEEAKFMAAFGNL